LGEDVTQIDYTTERVKRMVGKVLTGNGITAYGNGAYSLIGGDELSDAERDALQLLCRQRLDAFREQLGEDVCAPLAEPHPDQRLSEIPSAHPRSGPLRVLRCARAPAGPGGGPHHPQEPGRLRRHQQPAGPLLPLQCRQARRLFAYARGRTDFRDVQASYGHREARCVFCALEGSGRVRLENELALCIADAYPVSEGHSLVIPRRHGADGLELNSRSGMPWWSC